jgi:hypothetical protein
VLSQREAEHVAPELGVEPTATGATFAHALFEAIQARWAVLLSRSVERAWLVTREPKRDCPSECSAEY